MNGYWKSVRLRDVALYHRLRIRSPESLSYLNVRYLFRSFLRCLHLRKLRDVTWVGRGPWVPRTRPKLDSYFHFPPIQIFHHH